MSSPPNTAFDDNGAEFIVEAFGWTVDEDGFVRSQHGPAPTTDGTPATIDEVAGVVKGQSGRPVILRDDSDARPDDTQQQTANQDAARTGPKRDVSARTANGECSACGGNAHSLLDGEHIWKCSEIVPKAALEQFIETLRNDGQDDVAQDLEAMLDD